MILLFHQYPDGGPPDIYYCPNDFLTDQEQDNLLSITNACKFNQMDRKDQVALRTQVYMIFAKLGEFYQRSTRSYVFEGVDRVIYWI